MKKIVLFILVFSGLTLAQDDSAFDSVFDRMEQRMMKMFENFFGDEDNINQMYGIGKDLFEISPFSGMMKKEFEYDWEQTGKGRYLVIKIPQNNQIDLKIENDLVQVSGQVKVEKENKTQYGTSKSVSIQSISEAFPVPRDCTSKNSKISESKEKNKIIKKVFFPFKNGKPGDPGMLHSQKSFDFPDLKDFKKGIPRPQVSDKRKIKKIPKHGSDQSNSEEMIPLFEDTGDSI